MRRLLPVLLMAFIGLATMKAEDLPVPSKFFKLDFVVQEVDGAKVVNGREYSGFTAPNNSCSLRSGSQIVLKTGPNSIQQFEASVNIDARVQELDVGLSVIVNAAIVSVLQDDLQTPPIVRTNKWSSTVLVPLRKQIVVFSSDDLTSKHKIQLLLTATPVK